MFEALDLCHQRGNRKIRTLTNASARRWLAQNPKGGNDRWQHGRPRQRATCNYSTSATIATSDAKALSVPGGKVS